MRDPLTPAELAAFEALPAPLLLARVAADPAFGRVAVLSSFGADAAVLLHLVAGAAPHWPVLVVDTGKLFGETGRHADALAARLGLRDVRRVAAAPERVRAADPRGMLWRDDPERCCDVRKVRPLNDALVAFDTVVSGRKRFQTAQRRAMAKVERADGRWKVNPLADWSADALAAHAATHALPAHPLVADGFRSIGCYTCTDRVAAGEDARAGRWRGRTKTECGIHMPTPAPGRLPRT